MQPGNARLNQPDAVFDVTDLDKDNLSRAHPKDPDWDPAVTLSCHLFKNLNCNQMLSERYGYIHAYYSGVYDRCKTGCIS